MRFLRQLLASFIIISFMIAAAGLLLVTEAQQGTSERYPWLEQLKALTTVRNIRLIILTRHEQSILSLTRDLFLQSEVAKELGIVELQFLSVPAENWPSYIENAKSKGFPIDVAWGGGPTLFNYLYSLGYLMPIDNATRPEHNAIFYELSKVPPRVGGAETYRRGDDGKIYWIGASISSFGFTINKAVLERYGLPAPEKWADLASPIYAKYLPTTPLISTADPAKSTSTTRIFEIILQAKGWEEGWKILTLLGANARIYPGSSDARDAVIQGTTAIGTTIDFYGYMAQVQNPNCKYIMPEGETIVNADPIAILKDTRYPVHAAAFVAWVLNEWGGQQVWLNSEINRLPINDLVFTTPLGQQRQDLKEAFLKAVNASGIHFDEALSQQWVYSVIYYFKFTVVDVIDDLQPVWAEIAKAYLNGEINESNFQYLVNYITAPLKFQDPSTGQEVTFTKEYAVQINERLTKEKDFYQAMATSWSTKARERYLSALELLRKAKEGVDLTQLGKTTTTQPTETTTPQAQPQGGLPTTLILIVLAVIAIAAYFIITRK